MSSQPWYIEWFNSPFYHKLYFERDEEEAREFITKLIKQLRPIANSRMVDVACGRGRHSRMLAAMGYQVTGFDLSQDSIVFAKKYESDNLEFFQHDMRLPCRVNYFDYAFNLFTSFGYFETKREHDDAIRTIAQSLKLGGSFVIDYLNVHFVEDNLVPNEIKVIGTTKFEIHRWQDINHFYKKIIITDPLIFEPLQYTEKVAKLSLGDFTDMLSYHQLQVMDVFGDYDLRRYDIKSTPRLIIVSRKNS